MEVRSRPFLTFLGILLMGTGVVVAQTDVGSLVERGVKDAALAMKSLSPSERDAVMKATSRMLQGKITFRNDGIAAAVHHFPGSKPVHVEWKDFKVTSITEKTVSEADRANGITKIYFVGFGCAASRHWKFSENRWSPWSPSGYFLFPGAAQVEERQGVLQARLGEQGQFLPGPGGAATGGAIQPAGKQEQGPALPPGMRRAGQ